MLDWSSVIPKKIRDMKPSGIRKFFDIVAEIPESISLGVGEPDFVTPYHIRKAAIQSIQRGETQYTANRGMISLRKEISNYFARRFGASYDPKSEILVTVGGSEAIDLAMRALLETGDEVLVPDPCFVSYAPCVQLAGGVPVPLTTRASENFRVTTDELERRITKKTKAVLLSYPNNPTGATMPKSNLEALAAVIKKHNLIVISDEIYAELTYGEEPFTSIASLDGMRERTVVVSGFSKAFAMTGWRIGYVLAPKELCSAMTKIHQFTLMCASTVSQHAAQCALTQGEADNFLCIDEMREQYNRRRRLMNTAFLEMGLDCFEPCGAFYAFPSVEKLGMTGDEFAEGLLKSKGVAVVPGSAFGEFGKYHVRCCYAVSVKSLNEALDRMAAFVKDVKKK